MSQQDQIEQWIQEIIKIDEAKMTDKQIKIIQAAVEVFAEKGYAASSTSEIAQKAGVAEGTIFRHYKTKKDLLLSIVSPMMSRLIAPFVWNDFKEVLESDYPTIEDFLYALAVNRLNFARKHIKLIKILLQEIPFQPMLQEEFKKHIGNKVFHRFAEIVEHFKSKGQIIEMPAPSLLRFSASAMIGLFISRFVIFPDQPWDEDKEIRDTIQLILNGISAKP
ncbi:TetR/AcrR family transcriptional regulator [Paenibacillus woosongensis]|uniref:TetR/AcrR family transcriptional regulator n=1 Tax=Paenibacillus woosongensis TaxID=307580 RepID=A0AA95I6Z2_9BACL|nr:TetR/AcrR family transcriptional regulator [Paenibacillus woosongensis]WHX48568.1 TetR/AcrR family transcriptional regulator [Paenibacillus woosongensis]